MPSLIDAYSEQVAINVRSIESSLQQELPSSDLVSERLEFLSKKVIELEKTLTTNGDQHSPEYQKTILELVLKREILAWIKHVNENHIPSDEMFAVTYNWLDIVLACSEQGLCDTNLPMTMIEELIDTLTNEGCERVFDYLESRVEKLTSGMISTKGKGLILLRFCNELLRRLSKSQDTIVCGRILMFLAGVFPLGERSGVNLRGDFNLENKTVFNDSIKDPTKSNANSQEENKFENQDTVMEELNGTPVDSPNDKTGKGKIPVDPVEKFYKAFWSLQKYFNNPTLLFASDEFLAFQESIDGILKEFITVSKHEKEVSGTKESSTGKRKREEITEAITPKISSGTRYFFPKFLTSRNLLELEISDLGFRRHILTQCLVLFQYLLGFTAAERSAWANLSTPNKSVQKEFTLDEVNEKWIKDHSAKVRTELRGSGSSQMENEVFFKTINMVLTRENHWVRWKAELCQKFEKEPLNPEQFKQAREHRAKITKPPAPYRYKLGTHTLTQLWLNGGTNSLDDLKNPIRYQKPTLMSFEDPIKVKQHEIQSKNEKYSNKTDNKDGELIVGNEEIDLLEEQKQSLTWRALRIASQNHLLIFNKIGAGDFESLIKEIENAKESKKGKHESEIVPENSMLTTFNQSEGVHTPANERVISDIDVETAISMNEVVAITNTPKEASLPSTPANNEDALGDNNIREVCIITENIDVSPAYSPTQDLSSHEDEQENKDTIVDGKEN